MRFGRTFLLLLVMLPLAAPMAAQEPPSAEAPAENREGEVVHLPGLWKWRNAPMLRFQRGDDPRWANPAFDDSGWEVIPPNRLPSRDGIYWIRARINVSDTEDPAGGLRDGVAIAVVASFDFYWDGRLIGRNGEVGADAESERPGNVDTLYQIPSDLLTPGEHLIALRMSSFHTGFPTSHYGVNFFFGNFARLLVDRTKQSLQAVLAVGGMVVLAVSFGVAWLLIDRRIAVICYAGAALTGGVMQALQAWRWLDQYPYSWHYPRLVAVALLCGLLGLLLVTAVTWQLAVPRQRIVFAVLAAVFLLGWFITPMYNMKAFWFGFAAKTAVVGLAGWAVLRGRRHAWVVLVGFTLSWFQLLREPSAFVEHTFFGTFGLSLVGGFVALALQWRDERQAARQAQLTAARLEIELLKRNIQPHFILNTLTTLMEVVEQEPKTAITLIGALADEFRILARVAGQTLIPLRQELELCRAHLQIMSLRKGRAYQLRVEDVDEAALVPPALFHTLIENGLTHQSPDGAEGLVVFRLRGDRYHGRRRYEFTAPGQPAEEQRTEAPQEGTGLRYVKARLEESYPGGWSLVAGAGSAGWRTIIEIKEG